MEVFIEADAATGQSENHVDASGEQPPPSADRHCLLSAPPVIRDARVDAEEILFVILLSE